MRLTDYLYIVVVIALVLPLCIVAGTKLGQKELAIFLGCIAAAGVLLATVIATVPSSGSALMQVMFALAVSVVILYGMLAIIQKESGKSSPKASSQMQKTVVIPGITDSSRTFAYETTNPAAVDAEWFRSMPRSVNQRGGASFTYTSWISLPRPGDIAAGNDPYVLFVKGDSNPVKLATEQAGKRALVSTQPIAFCPSVTFSPSRKELTVEFNTSKTVRNTVQVSGDKSVAEWLGLDWFLLSIVAQDVYGGSVPTGAAVDVYINDTLVGTRNIKGESIQQNDGPMVVFPKSIPAQPNVDPPVRVADVTYYNYPLQRAAISKVYRAGPSKTMYTPKTTQDAVKIAAGVLQLPQQAQGNVVA
jgi:hypothetical protein